MIIYRPSKNYFPLQTAIISAVNTCFNINEDSYTMYYSTCLTGVCTLSQDTPVTVCQEPKKTKQCKNNFNEFFICNHTGHQILTENVWFVFPWQQLAYNLLLTRSHLSLQKPNSSWYDSCSWGRTTSSPWLCKKCKHSIIESWKTFGLGLGCAHLWCLMALL